MVIWQNMTESWRFIGFQNGCCLPSLIFKNANVLQFVGLRCPICIVTPNFTLVGQTLVQNFNFQYGSQGHCVSICQILCRLVNPLLRYGDFLFFKMAAVRHLGFLKFQNFKNWYDVKGQYASPCKTSCRSVNPLPRYGDF